MTATELADRIAARQVSSTEAVAAYLDRLTEVDKKLNAVTVPLGEQAIEAAKKADQGQATNRPLHGVPVSVKECFDVTGTATTAGLKGLSGHRATKDATLVARLRAAGAIVIAKSNLSQLMLYVESDNPLYGRTGNPWDLARTPGGSSGGEGALVAAGASALGLGTDIGGSVRVPAHFCGICGLRPTPGLLSLGGTADERLFSHVAAIPDCAGPLARTVADLRLAMNVLGAPIAAAKLNGVVIGMYEDDGFFAASPAIRRAVQRAGSVLEAAGARVVEFKVPDIGEALDVFYGLFTADGGAAFKRVLVSEEVDPRVQQLMQLASMTNAMRPVMGGIMALGGSRRVGHLIRVTGPRSGSGLKALIERRDAYRKRFDEAMTAAGADMLLCPPNSLPALVHRASGDLGPASVNYTALYNLLAWPAGVVPVTRVRSTETDSRPAGGDGIDKAAHRVDAHSAGLPVGVQIAARPNRDDLVLAAMAAIEEGLRGSDGFPTAPPI